MHLPVDGGFHETRGAHHPRAVVACQLHWDLPGAALEALAVAPALLPPGGWADLSPVLQISLSGERGSLPTSQTCFNLLVLPWYDSYQQLERALLTAVREGSEGFLLA